MTDFGGKAGRPYLVEADIFVEVERESIRANSAMKGDEHLALLRIADALYGPDQPRTLRHQEFLMVVGVVVGRKHDQNGPAETAIDVVRHDTFENRSLEDAVEATLILVEV